MYTHMQNENVEWHYKVLKLYPDTEISWNVIPSYGRTGAQNVYMTL